MTRYLLSVHSDECEPPPPMTEEEMQQSMQSIFAFEQEMKEAGVFVFSGSLTGADEATVVRRTDGATTMTDGPFAEAKEHIGGFYMIDVDDLDAALEWGARTSELISMPIEVRAFFDMPTD